ncbi:MAG: dTDP-4-amino-4,6-dideoxygalactose transaminase [Phycisphaerales bacterium]
MIPFNRPFLAGRELDLIRDAIDRMDLSGDAASTRACQRVLEETLTVPRALLTTSCTHALEMAALLLDIAPGDEVIVPSFTFVSTANAFALRGARPVFTDVRPDTLNMDEGKLESLITTRTRAIVPVHYAGVGCEMDSIMATARARSIHVVEDNAHGLFGSYRGRALGTFAPLATLSFHETKNFTMGEGGALLINDPSLVERAEIIREKGTDRSKFYRGQVDKYTWRDLGSSFAPSGILAAFLLGQLERRDDIQARRAHLWDTYRATLADWAAREGVTLPTVPDHCRQAYHMFYMLMPTNDDRDALIAHLKARDISAVFHYVPLHLSAMGRQFGGKPGDCPVTEDVSARLVRLPFYNAMTPGEQALVIDAVSSYRCAPTSTRAAN